MKSMHVSKHSRSAQPIASVLLRAWLALSLGWLLLPGLQSAAHGVEQSVERMQRVRIDAELRAGEKAPAPVADVASAQGSLRALHARIRTGANQPFAAPPWLVALLLPSRQRSHARLAISEPVSDPVQPSIAWHWPLPRSSCHADDDPSTHRS
jgi:hypothetical protein